MPIYYWLLAIPVLGVLLLIHEIGHFLAARWMKVRVEEFGLGFPPRMLTLGERNGVRYTLNWLPLGGFVKLAGEEDPTVPGSLAGKKPWQRVIVLTAGAFMNLLLGFALFTGLAIYGREEIVSQRIGIVWVEPGSPAEAVGLQPGDVILAINGRPATSAYDLRLETELNRGYTVTLSLERDGQLLTRGVTPRRQIEQDQGPIGIRLAYYEAPVVIQAVAEGGQAAQAGLRPGDTIVALDGTMIHDSLAYEIYLGNHLDQKVAFTVQRGGQTLAPVTLLNSTATEEQPSPLGIQYIRTAWRRYGPAEGWKETVGAAVLVPQTLGAIFRGSVPVSGLSGPVGIVYLTGRVAQEGGLPNLLYLMAVISINLFLVNLFPLPALDGGRVAFVLLEWIRRGKRIPPEQEGLVHMVGFFLLIAFVLVLTYFNVVDIISGTMGGR